MDRQDLDGLGVGLQPAAALLVARVLARPRRSAAAARRSARWCRAARPSPPRAGAGRRGAGRSAAARRRPSRSTRSGRPSTSVIVSVSAATPRAAQHAAPSRAGAGGRSSQAPRRRARPARRSSRGTASARPSARARRDVGRSSASSSRSQSRAGAGAEDAARAVDDRGDADLVERVAHERGVAVRAHEHGDVAGAHALAPRGRAVLARGSRSRRRRTSSRTRSAARSSAMCSRADALLRVARRA